MPFCTGFFHCSAQGGIGCNTTCDGKFLEAILFAGMHGMLHQYIRNCLLERSCHIRRVDRLSLHLTGIQIVQHSRL